MPIFTAHGQSWRVTKPSISPEMNRKIVVPTAAMTSVRPAMPALTRRGCGPGTMSDQNRAKPVPAATKIMVNSSSPCGAIHRKKASRWPKCASTAAEVPSATAFCTSITIGKMPVKPNAIHSAAIQALLVNTRAANAVSLYSE